MTPRAGTYRRIISQQQFSIRANAGALRGWNPRRGGSVSGYGQVATCPYPLERGGNFPPQTHIENCLSLSETEHRQSGKPGLQSDVYQNGDWKKIVISTPENASHIFFDVSCPYLNTSIVGRKFSGADFHIILYSIQSQTGGRMITTDRQIRLNKGSIIFGKIIRTTANTPMMTRIHVTTCMVTKRHPPNLLVLTLKSVRSIKPPLLRTISFHLFLASNSST